MRIALLRGIIAVLLTVCSAASLSAQSQKIYVFGNSLIHHLTESDTTTVPHWLAYFARQSGRSFALDGQWGFLKDVADKLPPQPEWRFADVSSAMRRGQGFEQVGYDTILFNPTNFVQYQSPDAPYEWDNLEDLSPVRAAEAILDQAAPQSRVVIYEGWADMGDYGYPPSRRKLRRYHEYNIGDYHAWYTDYLALLEAARPDLDISLIPVARILSRALRETGLSGIPVTDLYSDDAPHGTATLYFLAAGATYAGLFGELPMFGDLPNEVHPLVEPYFNAFNAIISEEIDLSSGNASNAPISTVLTSADDEPVAPSLAMGLNGVSDWSTQLPFVDLMKSARPWIGHMPGQWGGWEESDLAASGVLDGAGWPTEIPDALTGIETLILTDMPSDLVSVEGLYRLRYDGAGRIDLTGRARAQRYGDGEIWFRYSPGDGSVGIKISETDPLGTGNYIRNISIVREDQIPLYEVGFLFNPDWIKLVQDLRLVRFMDWMVTNDATSVSWSDRPQVLDYSYMRRGVPAEVMIALANHVSADPWFNMPHTADDSYVTGFADLVASDLRAGLKAHVEFSNEIWNFIFPQSQWAVSQAKLQWGEGAADEAWYQFAGVRAAEVMKIWADRFNTAPERLVRVAAVHTGWPGLETAFLEAPLSAVRPADYFDAYAVSGYVGHELGSGDGSRMVKAWLVNEGDVAGQPATIARAIKEIRGGSMAYLIDEAWPHHAEVAARYGLDFIMYEGGTHVVGHGEAVNDPALTAFFHTLNYAPEMGTLYADLIAVWSEAGGRQFNAFVDVAPPSKWGSWGALRTLEDHNARFDALMAYNHSGLGRSDPRQATDFAQGVILQAEGMAGPLAGTPLADVLIGGAGDDEIVSAGGADRLHGGAGVDHAVLPGFMEEYRFSSAQTGLRAQSNTSDVLLVDIETLSFAQMPEVIVAIESLY